MTDQPNAAAADPVRPWRIATVVLAIVVLTLLVTAGVLRARADAAALSERQAVGGLREQADIASQEKARKDQLLAQLSQANELTSEALSSLPDKTVTAGAVRRAIADWRGARGPARGLAESRLRRLCAQASVNALRLVHSGADIESGAEKSTAAIKAARAACQVGLR